MKNKLIYIFILFFVLQACKKTELPLTRSNLNTKSPFQNKTDIWLDKNFVDPYNISVSYKWNENKVDLHRYLYPPKLENVIPAASVIKKVWIDSYSDFIFYGSDSNTLISDEDFIKKIAPREFILVGGININPSATITLGLAEAGKSISLFQVDDTDFSNKKELIRFIGTIQHEYTHILNQIKPFDEQKYEKITPVGYTAQWHNEKDQASKELGFISSYARANPKEDFAEMVRMMLSNSKQNYDKIINDINSDKAKTNLRKKEEMIVTYFNKKFKINFYKLQEIVAKNVAEISH